MSPTFNFPRGICSVFGFKFLPPQTKRLYWCDKKYNNLIWAPLTKCPQSVCELNFYNCRKMTQNYNLNPYNTSFFKVLNLLCRFRLVSMLTGIIQIFLGSWMIYPWESSTIIMSSFSWIMWNPFLSTVLSATWSLTFYYMFFSFGFVCFTLWLVMNAIKMISSLEISPNTNFN